jgi:uncharacterized SAM-binding protein YcdF (DUF218 family)
VARDRLLVLLGHRRPGLPGLRTWRISGRCLERLRLAERLSADPRVRAVLLCGCGEPDRPSEATQMRAAWRGPPTALVLDEQSGRTATNALAALALARSLPEVRELVVVTSSWHVRARLYFGALRRHGYGVHMRTVPVGGARGRYVLYELAALGEVPVQRRRIRSHLPARPPGGDRHR